MAEIAHGFAGDVMILIHTTRPPGDAEWAEMCAVVEARTRVLRTLVFADSAPISSPQRKLLTAAIKGRPDRAAIVSASFISRKTVAALNWFNPLIRTFAPSEMNEAFQYLGIPPEDVPAVWEVVHRLRNQLGDLRSASTSA